MQACAHDAQDRGKVVHARIARGRAHAVQALARLGRHYGELLETDRGIDEIAQNQPRGLRFAIQEQRGCLVEQRLRERGIPIDAFGERSPEIACQCSR